jgi:hypothetical protein
LALQSAVLWPIVRWYRPAPLAVGVLADLGPDERLEHLGCGGGRERAEEQVAEEEVEVLELATDPADGVDLGEEGVDLLADVGPLDHAHADELLKQLHLTGRALDEVCGAEGVEVLLGRRALPDALDLGVVELGDDELDGGLVVGVPGGLGKRMSDGRARATAGRGRRPVTRSQIRMPLRADWRRRSQTP